MTKQHLATQAASHLCSPEVSKVVVHVNKPWVHAQRLHVTVHGLGDEPLGYERAGHVVVRVCEERLEPQRRLVVHDRHVDVAKLLQRVCQIGVRFR
jgi:hypothetical protein